MPPPEVEKKVATLPKHALEDVIAAILPIQNSTYIPMQIDPRSPFVKIPVGMKEFRVTVG